LQLTVVRFSILLLPVILYSWFSWIVRRSKSTRRTSWSVLQRSLGNCVRWWIYWCSRQSCLLLSRIRVCFQMCQ